MGESRSERDPRIVTSGTRGCTSSCCAGTIWGQYLPFQPLMVCRVAARFNSPADMRLLESSNWRAQSPIGETFFHDYTLSQQPHVAPYPGAPRTSKPPGSGLFVSDELCCLRIPNARPRASLPGRSVSFLAKTPMPLHTAPGLTAQPDRASRTRQNAEQGVSG